MSWFDYLTWRNTQNLDLPVDPIHLSEIQPFLPNSQPDFWFELSEDYPETLLNLAIAQAEIDWLTVLTYFDWDTYYELLNHLPAQLPDAVYTREISSDTDEYQRFIALMRVRPSYLGYSKFIDMYREIELGGFYPPPEYYTLLEQAFFDPMFLIDMEIRFPNKLPFIPDAMLGVFLSNPKSCPLFAKYLPSRIENSDFMDFSSLCSSMPSLTVRSALKHLTNQQVVPDNYIDDMYNFLSSDIVINET